MTATAKRGLLAVAAFAGFAAIFAEPATAAVAYYVTVNTSAVSGTTGFVNFQFNPGNSGSQEATAQIAEFTDGSFNGVPTITGNVTGTLPEGVWLVNSAPLNDYFHQVTYASKFSFVVILSGPAIDAPNDTSTAGTTLSLVLYNSSATPILTNQGMDTGAAGQIDIHLNGALTTTAFPTESGGPSVVSLTIQPVEVSYMRYFSNLNMGDSLINITNTGENGPSLYGPGLGGASGNLCLNVYAFSPDEQLLSCCSCLVTPNGLVHLSVTNDVVSNTLTGIRPNSTVVKIISTGAGPTFKRSNCANSAALAGTPAFPLASGMLAWGTTLHAATSVEPAPPGTPFTLTETAFLPVTLNRADLSSLTSRCAHIIGNGSTFGQCRSCRPGGLGSSKL